MEAYEIATIQYQYFSNQYESNDNISLIEISWHKKVLSYPAGGKIKIS